MENDKTWQLDEIRILYRDYGEYKGMYIGRISFKNKSEDSFVFNLSPEKADKFLQLIGHELVIQGNDLGKNLLKSIGMERILSH